jgi:hypothetical protein
MADDSKKEIRGDRFTIVLADEHDYVQNFDEILNPLVKNGTKICYICLNKPYKNVFDELLLKGTDTSNFFFLDVLTSHYEKPISTKNCIFIDSPLNLEELEVMVSETVKAKNCDFIVFDTISTLLVYHQPFALIKFAHRMTNETPVGCTNKLFIVLREDVADRSDGDFEKDLEMFADKKLEFKGKQRI